MHALHDVSRRIVSQRVATLTIAYIVNPPLLSQRLREEVLTDLHEGPLSGHLGVDKTMARVQEHFY